MAFLKFLGTAGTRFMVMEQQRASGGVWLGCGDDNIILDPGPGALVRAWQSVPPLDPRTLTGIVLSHRHLDHSGDVNVMVEAMTRGGRERRGGLFAPADAFDTRAPVVHDYLRGYPARLEILRAGQDYRCGRFAFRAVRRLAHPGETYGLRFACADASVSFICDSADFAGLDEGFAADTLVINVVLEAPRPDVFHLSLPEAEAIIARLRPRRAVLTHFGRGILAAGPEKLAAAMGRRLGLPVLAAFDGLWLDIG